MISIKTLELFAGAGGLALGLQMAGFNHVALYERDSAACKNLNFNIQNDFSPIKNWNVIQTDVRSVNYRQFEGKIQLLAGGPPCQPFSRGGKHKSCDDARDMFPEAIRAVRESRPKAFIFENVQGLLRKNFQTYFNYILLQLQYPEIVRGDMTLQEHLSRLEKYHSFGSADGLFYRVLFHEINAADYGIPQNRRRVILVGFRSDFHTNWSFPFPTHSRATLEYSKWISADYWAEHNLPVPQENPLTSADIRNLRHNVEENIFPLQRWRTVRDALKNLSEAENIFNNELRSGAKVYKGHSGSSLDMPSKAIKAGVHGVPGGENMLIEDDGRVRYYTVRESAEIQTFPHNYIFVASYSENMRQIGNAVPVELARVIGESLYEKFK
ncbi:MAG: DNA cytosine methyltransferase [Selenomonadaceae bacterium]|nr:DNA cytosine methyltransferase [Selenomonadaceae bacterium]